jgi:membrane protein
MEKLKRFLNTTIHYLFYLKERASHDRLKVNAGYMAYITLLSLVPLSAVILSAMTRFPAFDGVGEQVQQFIFSNFVPAAGDAISGALDAFVANTAKMTTVGALALFVTALLLISAIDNNLNFIWRVRQKRRRVYSFSMYWMVLTLGPLLIGSSIALSSHITSLSVLSAGAVNLFYRVMPSLLSYFAFFGLYLLVPNIKVRVSHALFGAFVAALLFELIKSGFAFYMTQFPSYHLIYGALAAIPILFVWVYLCWFIVLIGAEITASLGEKEKWHCEVPLDFHVVRLIQHKLKGAESDSADSEGE